MNGFIAGLTAALIAMTFALALPAVALATDGDREVDVCHVPPGVPWNAHTLSVDWHAVPAHLAHGDKLGKCPPKPPPTCKHSRLCDHVVIVEEPPGENCPNGGIKVILVRGERDRPEPTPQTVTEDPPDRVFYVCNGQDGEPGPPGPPGETPVITLEPPGENCPTTGGVKITLGEDTFYICNGIPTQGPAGPVGPAGPAGPPGEAGQLPVECSSTRVAHWRLVVRKGHRVRALRGSFEGVRADVERGVRRGRRAFRVEIDMTGLPKGIYVARVRFRIDTGNGRGFHRSTRVHLFRTCVGNIKGGLGEGPNRLPITIL